MTTHYVSSSGELKDPAKMNYHNLAAAHAKLLREEPHRTLEIEAMGAEIEKRDAEHAAEQATATV